MKNYLLLFLALMVVGWFGCGSDRDRTDDKVIPISQAPQAPQVSSATVQHPDLNFVNPFGRLIVHHEQRRTSADFDGEADVSKRLVQFNLELRNKFTNDYDELARKYRITLGTPEGQTFGYEKGLRE